MSLVQRVLSPIVDMRKEERTTALLMFGYSFLAMAGYNIVKPATRSQFINSLGADNLPYVQLVAGLIMGFVIQGYTSAMRLLPRGWVFAATQLVMVVLLGLFWALQTSNKWVSVGFYLWGVLAGSLLISQFWSLANIIYEPRQAKRLFGFIGGGASLGGIVGAGFAGQYAKPIGTNNLLLVAGLVLLVCFAIVWVISMREKPGQHGEVAPDDEKGMSPLEAIRLLRESKHFQVIALVISFAAIGAGIIDQQLNMAVQEGIPGKDERTAYLGNVTFYASIAGFVIQMTLTSRVHRLLGIGFALLLMPVSVAGTAALMLWIPALWTSTTARVLDTSLRYTVDKTTREILFMPLPTAMKYKAKPFADVAVDRFAKGVGAAVALIIAIKVFHLTWWQLSYLSLAAALLWVFMALRARREYLSSFRKSLASREMEPTDLRVTVADLSTIETLMHELAHPEPARVVYAIDVLESLDKRNLVTPLLLYHESPAVRERTLRALGADAAERWTPQIHRALSDSDAGVRTAALRALATVGHEDAVAHARPLLGSSDPRIRTTAALALTGSIKEADVDLAYTALVDIVSDSSPASRSARRDVAAALADIPDERFKGVLVPLLYDQDVEVADAAMQSVRRAGSADFIFLPALISMLRNRQLKAAARETLVSYGDEVIGPLAHFMRDANEDIWLRRHIPTTISSIVSQKSVDVLIPALQEPDGFLRYKIIASLERLRRADDTLVFDRTPVEPLAMRQARAFLNTVSLHHNLFVRGKLPSDTLLARALEQKMQRSRDRIYRLLSLIYPWRDIDAAQWTLSRGDSRARSSATEYLDNLLSGQLRHLAIPVLEELPLEERVRKANVIQKTRPRDIEETLLELINDEDQVIAAVAIDVVRQQRVWALAPDVEHVLAHRDARDWYVFEEASWALAEQRMPAERRRELWLEPLPAAVLADRLRGLPLFASVSVDELFRIAAASKQVRHESGAALMTEGTAPDNIHLLLDGRVIASGGSAGPSTIEAPAAVGFGEALEGAPVKQSVRTSGVAVTLAMTTDELRSLLADNTELVRGLFAEMSQRAESSVPIVQPTGAARDLEQLAAEGVTPIEKVLALQRVPYFANLSADEMQRLAGIARPMTMAAGSPLFAASSPPATWLVLSGEVELEQPGGPPATVRGGDTIGSFAALSGHEIGLNANVTRNGVALRIGRDELFELMAERPDLLRQMFAGISRLAAAGV